MALVLLKKSHREIGAGDLVFFEYFAHIITESHTLVNLTTGKNHIVHEDILQGLKLVEERVVLENRK